MSEESKIPGYERNPYDLTNFVVGDYAKFIHEVEYEEERPDGAYGRVRRQRCSNCNSRLIICFSAIACLWLTSWGLAMALVQAIFNAPTATEVEKRLNVLLDYGKSQSDSYKKCIDDQTRNCNNTLKKKVNTARDKYLDVAIENAEKVETSFEIASTCNDRANKTIMRVSRFYKQLGEEEFSKYYTDECSRSERRDLSKYFADPSLATSKAINTVATFTNEMESAFGGYKDVFDEQEQYTNNYLIDKEENVTKYREEVLGEIQLPDVNVVTAPLSSLKNEVDVFVNCSTFSPSCPEASNLRDSAEERYKAAQKKIEDMEKQAKEQKEKLEKYEADLNEAIEAFQTEAEKAEIVMREAGGVADGLGVELPAPTTPDISVGEKLEIPNVPSVNLPDASEKFDEIQVKLEKTAKDQTDPIKDTVNVELVNVELAAEDWRDVNERALEQQLDELKNVKTDIRTSYDPQPPVQPNASQLNGSKLENDAKKNLADLQNVKESLIGRAGNSSDKNISLPSGKGFSVAENKFKQMSGDPPSFAGWDWVVTLLDWALTSLDVIFRCYWTCRIFIRYWYGSAVAVPSMDIRKFKTTVKKSYVQKLFEFLTHPIFLFGGTIGMVVVIILAVISFYVPYVQSYIVGCVETSRGTFLSNNTYVVVYNGAGGIGNADIAAKLARYDTDRAQFCSVIAVDSETVYEASIQQMEYSRRDFLKHNTKLNQLGKCMNTSWDGWDYPPIEKPDEKDDCYIDNIKTLPATLNNATINCGNNDEIPICSYTCQGPDKSVLKQQSTEAVCFSEWWMHSFLLRYVCTLSVFIFWNLSRNIVFMGIVMVCWKILSPKGFEYLATCDREGNALENVELELQTVIPKTIGGFERRGKFYIAAGILINIIPIVLVYMLSTAIAFPSNLSQ